MLRFFSSKKTSRSGTASSEGIICALLLMPIFGLIVCCGDVGAEQLDCNPNARNIEHAVCLQDMNDYVKFTMLYDVEYELRDARDGTIYKVAKLDDNNVWLLDNLRIGGENEVLLTSNDTNTNPELNGGNFWLPASGEWTNSYTEAAIDASEVDTELGVNDGRGVGVYYNYCAASAGTICDDENGTEKDAEFDICPAGWRMPVGGHGGEYTTLKWYYDDVISTLHLPLSGRFYDNEANYLNQYGYFWSSTYRDGSRMYFLSRNGENINTSSHNRDRGFSMRCVAMSDVRPEFSCNGDARSIDDAVCLQDMNAMVEESMEIGKEYALLDSRDKEIYRTKRLDDNHVWLIDNLRIGGDEEILLTSNDTNTNPELDGGNFVLPASGDWVNSFTEPAINIHDDSTIHSLTDRNKSIGGYYNYCAVSAGTVCNEEEEAETNAEYDICPVSWRLPTGGEGGEYQAVTDLYGDDTAAVLQMPLSGRFYDGESSYLKVNGYFWSSTNYDGSRMYELLRADNSFDPLSNYYRDRGYSARCIFDAKENGNDNYYWKDDVSEYTLNTERGLTLIIERAPKALLSVWMGDRLLDASEYDIAGTDQTEIILKNAFLDTLAVGEYPIKAVYKSGYEAETSFTIKDIPGEAGDNDGDADGSIAVPNTGNGSHGLNFIIQVGSILPIFGLIVYGISVYIKRKKSVKVNTFWS